MLAMYLLRFYNGVLLYETIFISNLYHIKNLHQNIKFTMEEESNGEAVFFDTLLY